MGNVVSLRGAHQPPKSDRSKMETLIVTQAMVMSWRVPPFQRPVRVNAKVTSVVEQIKSAPYIEGVLTLGVLKSDPSTIYIVDGQHRIEAFKISEVKEAIADVRVIIFDSMAEMAEEFVHLNSSLVKMRPDDILRGLENSVLALKTIRKTCDFVGYDQIRRRGGSGPIVSMSALIRCWRAASYETPAGSTSGLSAAGIAQSIDQTSLQNLLAFLSVAHTAWGRDPEYYRLWGNLNLTLCMWLWNKLIIDKDRSGNKRYATLSIPEFKKCLMSISTYDDYLSWLVGRALGDRDRSPAYSRLKNIFAGRLAEDRKTERIMLPQPAWSS
jgi:hypothetical protein